MREFRRKDFAVFLRRCMPLLVHKIDELKILTDTITLITDLKPIHFDSSDNAEENLISSVLE
jgi:hypothetical protein